MAGRRYSRGRGGELARPDSTRARVARAAGRAGHLSQPSRCSSSRDLREGGMRLVEKCSVTFERAVVPVLRPARAGSIERFPTVIPTRPAAPDSQSSTESSVSAEMSPLTLASACHASVSAVTLASHHGITPSSSFCEACAVVGSCMLAPVYPAVPWNSSPILAANFITYPAKEPLSVTT